MLLKNVFGHPPSIVFVWFIPVNPNPSISESSITNPHAVWEKLLCLHSSGVDLFTNLNVWVPNLDVAISFVSPTLYLSVFSVFTALAIVAHESLAKDIG